MRVDRAMRVCFAAAVLASASVAAFEPGKPRVCQPSADGQRFECRDRDVAAPVTASSPSAPPAAPREAGDAAAGSAVQPTSSAATEAGAVRAGSGSRSLPNYLLQTPAHSPSAPAVEEAPREVSASPAGSATKPTPETAVSAPAPIRPPAAPPASVAAPPVDGEAGAASARPTTTPRATAAATAQPEPEPARVSQDAAAARAPASLARNAAGATEFNRLPSTRYTVELAKSQRPDAFDALLDMLGNVEGTLYVVALRTPEGRSWHLLWSDFASIEAARSARARLPADATITSGWPRRIGPLRAELDAP